MVQFGALWCIFGSDFVFKKFQKLPFFYIKNLKIHVEIHSNYSCTHMLGSSGAYASCLEKILKMWCSLVRFGVYFDQIVS